MAFELLKKYVDDNFSELNTFLTDEQYEQINWIDTSNLTPERVQPYNFNPQQLRIFARLHFLCLLRKGDTEAYAVFTAGQNEPRLTEEHFKILAESIKCLSEDEYQQLWLATITFRSPTAITLAEKKLNQKTPFDGVEFLALVMTQCPEIYPAINDYLQANPKAKENFAAMFNTGHFRHMMYVEGGNNMFAKLRSKIENGEVDSRKFNLWFAYWLIDITGFRGHTEQGGSAYLNDNTFKAINALKGHLIAVLNNPRYPALQEYLNDRATWLGISNQPTNNLYARNEFELQRSILARIAAMHRLFTANEKEGLLRGLQRLKQKNEREYFNIIEILNPLFITDEPTPTYGPALFTNLCAESNFEEAVLVGLPLYAQALSQYRTLRADNQIDKSIPLSFSGMAEKNNIKALLSGASFGININPENGTTSLRAIKLEEKLQYDLQNKFV